MNETKIHSEAETQRTIKRLQRFLTRAEADGYGFCVADDERNIPSINKKLISTAKEKNIEVLPIFLRPDSDLPLLQQFKNHRADALIVNNLFDFLIRRPDKSGYSELNFIRESVNALGIPLIFWVSRRALSDISNFANDFYSQRQFSTHFIETPAEISGQMRSLETTEFIDAEDLDKVKSRVELLEEQLLKARTSDISKAVILKDIALPLAQAYAKLGEEQAALALLREFEEDIDEEDGDILLETAKVYHGLYQYESALVYYDKAAAIYKKNTAETKLGYILIKISEVYHIQGNYNNALEYLERSLLLKKKMNDLQGEGVVLNNISLIYDIKGDYNTALKYQKRSLEICNAIEDIDGKGMTLNNMATTTYAMGNVNAALKYLEQSLQICPLRGKGAALNNLSQIYQSQGDYDAALKCLKDSLKLSEEIGDRFGKGVILNNIAHIYDEKGDYSTAFNHLMQSLQVQTEIGDFRGKAVTLSNIALLLLENGRAKEAVKFARQSLNVNQKIALPNEVKKLENILTHLLDIIGKTEYEKLLKKAINESEITKEENSKISTHKQKN